MGDAEEDEFDLLVQLNERPLCSYAAWGEELGWAPSKVRRRLLDLRSRGVFEGFMALPSAAMLGRREVGLAFHPDRAVPADEALAVDDAVSMAVVYEGSHYVIVYDGADGTEHPAAEAALSDVFGVAPYERVRAPARPEVSRARYGALDWRIARAFIDEPRASLQDLATATGLSARTVRARRDRMVSDGAIDVWPLLRPARVPGPTYYHLGMFGSSPRVVHDALRANAERFTVISESADPPMVYAFCRAKDMVEQQRVLFALQNHPEIRHVKFLLTVQYDVAWSRVHGWLDAEVARWAAAKRPA